MDDRPEAPVPLAVITREWLRIGVTGFGGPPTHIALLRALCVDRRGWLEPEEFEDGVAATSLLPGPASTQLAIFCAWRLRGRVGALVGGLCFIVPGLVVVLALSALFLARHPPLVVLGLAAGAGSGVPGVALAAAVGLLPASLRRVRARPPRLLRWTAYLVIGAVCGATADAWLVLALLACGIAETLIATGIRGPTGRLSAVLAAPSTGGVGGLLWVAVKVGALSFGGGFVIVPLMQHDAVDTYHWMSAPQFLNAVALGQLTPGPVLQTVAVVGFAAAGLAGGILAAGVAFLPSFVFVLVGAPRFSALRTNRSAQNFLTGAGGCAIGGIAGVAVPLAADLRHPWEGVLAAVAAVLLVLVRRDVVSVLLGCAAVGAVAALVHAPLT